MALPTGDVLSREIIAKLATLDERSQNIERRQIERQDAAERFEGKVESKLAGIEDRIEQRLRTITHDQRNAQLVMEVRITTLERQMTQIEKDTLPLPQAVASIKDISQKVDMMQVDMSKRMEPLYAFKYQIAGATAATLTIGGALGWLAGHLLK